MKTLAFANLLASVLLLGACAAPSDLDDASPELVVVTADDTDGLGPSQRIEEPFVEGFVYRFDASQGPIDFGRIDLVDERSDRISMNVVVSQLAAAKGVDASSFARQTFQIARRASEDDMAGPGVTPQDTWFFDAVYFP